MSKRLTIETAAFRAGLAARLRMVRLVRESNGSEVARTLGIGKITWLRYENGDREIPLAAMATFCTTFEVCPRWLLLADPSGLNAQTVLALRDAFGERFSRFLPPQGQAQQAPQDDGPTSPAGAGGRVGSSPSTAAQGRLIAQLDRIA